MRKRGDGLKEATQVWDERDSDWKIAYEARVRRIEHVEFLKEVLFNSTAEAFTSKSFECAAFRAFTLMINLVVANAPTDIRIDVEFSHDNINFYKHMDGPFGSLMYEDSAGNKKECVIGRLTAQWMRIYVLSSGCTASATFTLSIDAELSAL
jgi:hypothetical protein